MTPEQRERNNARAREHIAKRRANRTPAQHEADLKTARERYANMTPEQREAKREREREAIMTPAQREAKRERDRKRRAAKKAAQGK